MSAGPQRALILAVGLQLTLRCGSQAPYGKLVKQPGCPVISRFIASRFAFNSFAGLCTIQGQTSEAEIELAAHTTEQEAAVICKLDLKLLGQDYNPKEIHSIKMLNVHEMLNAHCSFESSAAVG